MEIERCMMKWGCRSALRGEGRSMRMGKRGGGVGDLRVEGGAREGGVVSN